MDSFDIVIIGAGAAGSTLALRLSGRGYSVCVIEAGPKARNPLIRIPSGIMATSDDERITWRYEMEGNAWVHDRAIPIFLGKTTGGSSAINGMIYNRGQSSDFDLWAQDGCAGWDYDGCLPYFRKSERYLPGGDPQYRGKDGPITVTPLGVPDDCTDRFLAACAALGMPEAGDYNGATQEGVSYVQAQIHRGRRQFSDDAFLRPAIRRHGARLLTGALVSRILIRDGRAIGVEYRRDGDRELRRVLASRAVILSAGAAMSPKILQLSGIGPAALLREHGIEAQLDLPGVGENLSDHYAVRMVAAVRPGHGTINERVRFPANAVEALRWLVGRPSILALTSVKAFTFNKLSASDRDTAFSMVFMPAALKAGMTRKLDSFPGVTGGVWQQRPESRGFVRIVSPRIEEAPRIFPNYLDAEIDRQVLIRAMRQLQRVFETSPLREVVTEMTLPARSCTSDDDWLDHIRRTGMTAYHLAGTCRMGAAGDPRAVVDARLRVQGIGNLRVIDASVMPTQVSGNLNAAVMMIAEKAADLMIEDLQADR